MAREEVTDGCCNAAISDPVVVSGVCCWNFCAGTCCGRPIRVLGEPIVARSVPRDDWHGPSAPATDRLPVATREALHVDFLTDALLEHASIASFSTFTLELLALGAPPELLLQAQAAATDEVTHARLTFAIAASFASVPMGPGPLPVSGIVPSTDLAAVAAACVRDGCIGETMASLIAAEQARRTTVPAIRDALSRIAEDEARHAELAWRFVGWALATGDATVRAAITRAFTSGSLLTGRSVPEEVDLAQWEAHGRLSAEAFETTARTAMRDVVRPCALALLAEPLPVRTSSAEDTAS
jgi:hypothetical protein